MTTQEDFNTRRSEIESYLRIIEALDAPEKSVPPNTFEPQQRNILHSVTYLLLYNLVESTIRNCVEDVVRRFSGMKISDVQRQSENIREKWLELSAGTHGANTNESERITAIKKLLEAIVSNEDIKIEYPLRKKHGNFSDKEIEKVAKAFGVSLSISDVDLRREIKGSKRIENIVEKRNMLSHGETSFADCGKDISYMDLKETANITFKYLEVILESFGNHLNPNNPAQ